jgi:ABC-2 type transport system permease protein
LIARITAADPQVIGKGLIKLLESDPGLVSGIDASGNEGARPDSTVIYFYSLMAMTCFYGAFQGLKEVNAVQADLSPEAMRVNVSPLRKMKIFTSSISSAALIEMSAILLLLAFMSFVLGIDFGNQLGLILLVCISGCFAGISFGTMLGALVKGGEGIKTAILISTTMVLSFLAGMMQSVVKYAVIKAVPALAYINPLNLITDAFYALYYYPDHNRFYINIACLWAFTIVFSGLTVIRLRRVRYASL